MADQGKWFKLWCLSLNDPDLENLSLENWARWVRLGVYTKAHGKDGMIRFTPPYSALLRLFQLTSIADAICVIKMFPHCALGERSSTVSPETNTTVSLEIEFDNWFKYQGDFSSDRVRSFRDKKRHRETVQEETRRRQDVEETRGDINTLAQAPKVIRKSAPQFVKPTAPEVTAYARTIGFRLDGEAFCAHYEARGWKYGAGRPMVDWKSAVVTWKKSASPTALIAPVKEKVVEAPPEELVSQEQVSGLVASLKAKVVPRA